MSEKWAHFEDASEAKGYTQISNVVMRHPGLSMPAKYLYGLLKSYAWQDPTTHPGLKRMCRDANASDKTLGKYLTELQDAKLIEVKRRGQGKTNLYVFKALSSGLDSDTGSDQDPEGGSDLEPDAGSGNEDSVNEDSVTNSRRDAKASAPVPSVMKNPFGYYCDVAKALRVEIVPEDRKETCKHFKDLVRMHEPTEEELKRVVSKMLEARTAGAFWSPQKTLEKVRASGSNVTPLRAVEPVRPRKRVIS